jgi:hypothetical protein
MERRAFIRNAAGLFVAAQLGIEVVPWRRKFFPGSDIARSNWIQGIGFDGSLLFEGDPSQPMYVAHSGTAAYVRYRGVDTTVRAQVLTTGGTVKVHGLEDLPRRFTL